MSFSSGLSLLSNITWIKLGLSMVVTYVSRHFQDPAKLTLKSLWFAVYQLWFHPLSKYPGPILAKFTNIYAAYHVWNGDLHVSMQNCHEKYGMLTSVNEDTRRFDNIYPGTFVRYGPSKLLINSSDGLQSKVSSLSNKWLLIWYSTGRYLSHEGPNSLHQRFSLHASGTRGGSVDYYDCYAP